MCEHPALTTSAKVEPESTATPTGKKNSAAEPMPSLDPTVRLPATVVTSSDERSSRRMQLLLRSACGGAEGHRA